MKRIICQFLLILFAALHVSAQTPLEAFGDQANALLRAQFGFGVTNMPIYCATNPAVAYSPSIHFQLQSAADLYDAGTPATNLPSVFRPLFSWQSNTLFIVGYSCVTTDFYTQIGQGFKTLADPTITTNDNVWGIPWVVGAKGQIPAFNEYCYSSAINVQRQLAFVRFGSPGHYSPQVAYTNQLYLFSISNIFGAEAWNFYQNGFTNSVTLMVSNVISISFTNNYNFGTTIIYDVGANSVVDGWPGGGFEIPLFMNTTPLPECYWSESTRQLVTVTNALAGFLPADLAQTRWPVHDWTVNITNNVMYALIDNDTGRVLDFVNLGGFGSSLDLNELLFEDDDRYNFWITAPATDAPTSPMSEGDMAQIGFGESLSPQFAASVMGLGPPYGYPLSQGIFFIPSSEPTNPGEQVGSPIASANIVQNCSWQAANPIVHYTVGDLTDPEFNQEVEFLSPIQTIGDVLGLYITNSNCTLGKINRAYNPGTVEDLIPNLSNRSFQLNFCGAPDLPYLVWASTNLIDWSLAGTTGQTAPGSFQFSDTNRSNTSMKFYDVQLP